MLQRCLLYLFVIGLMFITSCKKNVKQVYLHNASISNGFDIAKTEKKGLILILNKSGCSMCEQFEIDLMKDENYAQNLYKDFIIQRVDENVVGQKWLSRILNAGGVPVFLFFSSEARLLAIKQGATSKVQMQKITENVKNNRYDIDNGYKFGKVNFLNTRDLAVYLENLCQAQAQWDRYTITRKKDALNGLGQKLDRTLSIQSSFYNNYLFTKYYLAKNDSLSAMKTAERALQDKDPASLYFNAGLRTELKTVLNKNFNMYDDPYIGINNIEKHLGSLKLGSINKILFKVKNLGKKDLLISRVLPDCGCTIANYTKTQIKPNAAGDIELSFKAERPGPFVHVVFVESNAINGHVQLYIKGLTLGE